MTGSEYEKLEFLLKKFLIFNNYGLDSEIVISQVIDQLENRRNIIKSIKGRNIDVGD